MGIENRRSEDVPDWKIIPTNMISEPSLLLDSVVAPEAIPPPPPCMKIAIISYVGQAISLGRETLDP